MRFSLLAIWACCCPFAAAVSASTEGLYDLVKRRLPAHCDQFVFELREPSTLSDADASKSGQDAYSVSTTHDGLILVQGNSVSSLSAGVRRYFTHVAHTDIYWFIGSRLNETNPSLPRPNATITGQSIVPWRYFFNTVTFSYTTPFFSWEDWELELDWLALHGVNLPLAWVGFEKILLDVFREIGLVDSEILPFFSGPAYQSWNRFGNIHGSWGEALPLSWIDSQFELQKQILGRMLELGMTPILPAFTGFVPRALPDRFGNATVVNGSRWEDFPTQYTNTTFLEPSDPLFAELQDRVISKQIQYYGNVTNFYTLDQYNENEPYSGDLEYLRNITHGTWQSLKAANPAAVWVMQGWLFYSSPEFWTNQRIEAFLSGVEKDSDMLILDLFSESQPEWQRTDSYYGKPWVWNELHDYGGNMGLYGQIDNVTINPVEALQNSSSLVGFGLTPEGQEGNEIIYKLLLDQAWSSEPIDTADYFKSWVTTRYSNPGPNDNLPGSLYTAWELLRTSAYNNTNLTSNAVPKAIYELAPNVTGLVNRTGHHPTTINYNPAFVVSAWNEMYAAAAMQDSLWEDAGYQHDFVDLTRQVLANAFLDIYTALIALWSSQTASDETNLMRLSTQLTSTLVVLDTTLSTLPQFSLEPFLGAARARAGSNTTLGDWYAKNALTQITTWGPDGEINDYASKSWGGLVGEYYLPRWEVFLEYLATTGPTTYNSTLAREKVKSVERGFAERGFMDSQAGRGASVRDVVDEDVVPFLAKLGLL
jgi:alpha-N-acetylglucosaminidase